MSRIQKLVDEALYLFGTAYTSRRKLNNTGNDGGNRNCIRVDC